MQSSLDNTIVPGFIALDDAAQVLRETSASFCEAPDFARLATLQGSWRDLARSWSAVAAYDLGPLDDDPITPRILFIESMRQNGTDYTDTVRESYALALSADATLDAAYFDALTFNQVGLLALEVLLFEDSRPGRSQQAVDVVADFVAEPRKCAYLEGIGDLLVEDVAAVSAGWTESFEGGAAFRDVMLESKLPDGREPIVGLLVAMQQHLDYVKVRKLAGTPDGQLSGTFYTNVDATLAALEQLLEQSAPEEAVGIFDFMLARGLDADVELVRGNLADAKAAGLAEDRMALETAFGLLDGNLKREIPDGLGVDLGLNFTDGD
jgi:predicted lipoprotein